MEKLDGDYPELTYMDFLRMRRYHENKFDYRVECHDPNFLAALNLMNKHKPILDMGICFEYTTQKLLEKGFKVIATDQSKENLESLWKNLTLPQRSQLVLKECHPLYLSYERNSLSGIVAIHCLHYLRGDEVRIIFERFYEWLEPGGVLVATCRTPYSWTFNKHCIERFAESAAKKVEWPGEFKTSDIIIDKRILDAFPNHFNLFTAEILIRETIRAGLSIFKVCYYDFDPDTKEFVLDGSKKDFVSIIAIKTR